jgi:hypothetical protein
MKAETTRRPLYRRIVGDHRMPLATALSKARFASGTRPKAYTTTWDTTRFAHPNSGGRSTRCEVFSGVGSAAP